MIEGANKNTIMEVTRLEFNSICRLCVQLLEKEKVSPIFNNETYTDTVSLSERIKYCSSVEVAENDGLPPQICNSCLSKLNQSFVFRNQCVLADITLKQLKDVSFSVNEISNLLKVDIENQIIKSEDDKCAKEIESLKYKVVDNLKKNNSIDEFENGKNGRHKRSIHKSKVHKIKTETENGDCSLELDGSYDDEMLLSESSSSCSKRKEGNKRRDSQGKGKKFLKDQKEGEDVVEKPDIKLVVDFNKQTDVENFTIEPDMFSYSEEKLDVNSKNISESNFGEFTKKSVKKIIKPKSLGMKKGRTKKVGVPKEKPSSYTCDYCQKVYPSEGGWRYHIHTMHNENYQPFICDLCGQAFKVKKNLEGHKNSIHFHLKLHLCDLCGRGFASKYALKVHKIWHNDEKNFTCDICGTKFRTRGKMNTHRSIHGGPKKFMCHICSRDFRWKKDFEIHMRTHTGEKPFKCSHCGKAFASLTNMKKHERNHLGKVEVGKSSDGFDIMSTTADDRLFLDFGYSSDDVRNRQVAQV